jgi:hypothetical protein
VFRQQSRRQTVLNRMVTSILGIYIVLRYK